MQVLHPRCAALDLGKDVLVAGVRLQEESSVQREPVVRTERPELNFSIWRIGSPAWASLMW